jgi:hypothetical protein
MEHHRAVFPRRGKKFSTLWKIQATTLWKISPVFFHAVEKSFPHCGKLVA